MKKLIDDELQLKKILDDKGFRFGDRFPSSAFVVSFIDVGTGALLSSNIVKSPIDGVANLPKACEATHRKPDDIEIWLDFGFDYNSRKVCDINVQLDKYIYFERPKKLDSSLSHSGESDTKKSSDE